MTELIERQIFPEPPGESVVLLFRRHLSDTGQPETFDQISTTRPPREGRIEVLDHPVNINRNRRPRRDRAPCPICSPSAGKFLVAGTLIWCEATRAIYVIGPECSHTLWEDGRLNTAVNIFRQTQTTRQVAIDLKHEVSAASERLSWIGQHRSTAERIAQLHASCTKEATQLRGALSRALKAPSPGTPIIHGGNFLRGTWKFGQDLDGAERELRILIADAGQDAEAWSRGLAPSVASRG